MNTCLGGVGGGRSTKSWKLIKAPGGNNRKEIITLKTTQKWDEYFQGPQLKAEQSILP